MSKKPIRWPNGRDSYAQIFGINTAAFKLGESLINSFIKNFKKRIPPLYINYLKNNGKKPLRE
jgi:hypothetical protein